VGREVVREDKTKISSKLPSWSPVVFGNMSQALFFILLFLFPKVPDFLLAKVQKSLLMKQQPQNEQQAIPGHCFLSTRMAMDGARSGIGVLESAGEKLRGGA